MRRDPKDAIIADVLAERAAQDRQWGEQNHPDGTGTKGSDWAANNARVECETAFGNGEGTWAHIFREEVAEALAESDPVRLRAELVQAVAVGAAWIEAIDRRDAPKAAA